MSPWIGSILGSMEMLWVRIISSRKRLKSIERIVDLSFCLRVTMLISYLYSICRAVRPVSYGSVIIELGLPFTLYTYPRRDEDVIHQRPTGIPLLWEILADVAMLNHWQTGLFCRTRGSRWDPNVVVHAQWMF